MAQLCKCFYKAGWTTSTRGRVSIHVGTLLWMVIMMMMRKDKGRNQKLKVNIPNTTTNGEPEMMVKNPGTNHTMCIFF